MDASRFATLYEQDSITRKFTAAPLAYAPRQEEIKNYKIGYSTPIFSPTGGTKISAVDLTKWMLLQMNKGKYKGVKIISRKSAKLMQTKISEKEGYRMAIMHLDSLIAGKKMTGHTGSAYGFIAPCLLIQKTSLTLL